jgi:hypothetical protein
MLAIGADDARGAYIAAPMRIKLISVAMAASMLIAAGVALGAAKQPTAGSSWFSKKPNVSIYVLKPAKHVNVFISCFVTPGDGDSWEGTLPLKEGSFELNKVVKVSTENGAAFGSKRTQVFLTGTFKSNKFVGAMQITGTTCAKGNYTAKFNKGGGSGK